MHSYTRSFFIAQLKPAQYISQYLLTHFAGGIGISGIFWYQQKYDYSVRSQFAQMS